MTDPIIPPLKKCSKCAAEYPATPEYFHRDKVNRDGLHYHCKVCVRAYHQLNRDLLIARQIAYQRSRPEKTKEISKRWYERHREWRKQYRENNRESINAAQRKYGAKRDLIKKRASNAIWAKNNPDKVRARLQRRRAKKRCLPNSWSGRDWIRCLDYWHYCCAVCGAQLRDLFGHIEPNADHWIPLDYKGADNPGTVPGNMICLCNKCNSSKKNKMPDRWLLDIYGKQRARIILERVTGYFDWIRQAGETI